VFCNSLRGRNINLPLRLITLLFRSMGWSRCCSLYCVTLLCSFLQTMHLSALKVNEKAKLTNIKYNVAIYFWYCSLPNIANHNVLVIIFYNISSRISRTGSLTYLRNYFRCYDYKCTFQKHFSSLKYSK
jgi:hypothetical protein